MSEEARFVLNRAFSMFSILFFSAFSAFTTLFFINNQEETVKAEFIFGESYSHFT